MRWTRSWPASGSVQEEYQQRGGYELEARAREVLHGLGFRRQHDRGDVAHLSGGWKMRVAMAKVLLAESDVLLMDEPTNHLDIESILWLEGLSQEYCKATLLMTCHDRDFMNRIVDRIVDIDGGELIEYSGDYDTFVAERTLRETQREASYQRQQAMLAKEQRFIERFSTRTPPRRPRFRAVSRSWKRSTRSSFPSGARSVKFEFRKPPNGRGKTLPSSEQDRQAVRRAARSTTDFGLTIRRGERWCVMGRNGAGKTTLLKMVAGELAPGQPARYASALGEHGLLRPAGAGRARSPRMTDHGADGARLPDGDPGNATQACWVRSSFPATMTWRRRSRRSPVGRRRDSSSAGCS